MQTDADEIVPRETAKKIKEALQNPGKNVAFKLIRKDHFKGKCLKHCGMYSTMIKIFNKKFVKYKEFGRRHEVLSIKGKIGTIDAEVNHYNYKGVLHFLNKQLYYANHEAEVVLEEKGVLPWDKVRYNLTIKPIKLFWKLHFKKRGYKDGIYGFIWNLLNTLRRIIVWLRYWEMIEDNNENRN
jgi:hypothetical protein